jgi:hypothetical protein
MNLLDIQLEQLDKIGLINDQIAALKEQAEQMKDVFKNAGEGEYEGNLYKGTVYISCADRVDYAKALEEAGLVIPAEILAKYTKQTVSIGMRVSKRKGK